jgi:hypothetical protein
MHYRWRLKAYCLALTATFVLAGCGGGGKLRSQFDLQPGASQAPQHFFYGHNLQLSSDTFSSVYGFGQDEKTGALSPLPASPFTVGPVFTFIGSGLASDPKGRFLFISSLLDALCCKRGLSTVASLDSTTGTASSSPVATVNGGAFATDPSGRFLYIASDPSMTRPECFGIDGRDLSTSNLASIPGSPSSSTPFLPLDCVEFVSIDPAGRHLYAGGGVVTPPLVTPHPAFAIYNIDSNTGVLTTISANSFPGVQPVGTMLFQPSGRFMYALDIRTAGPVVDLYSVNPATGALTFVNTQLNNTLVNPIMSSSGNFLYGCTPLSGQPCQPVAYRVDNNTGALTQISGFNLGAGQGDTLILDKSGRYAYALDAPLGQSSTHIFVYSVDSSTGSLTQMPNLTTGVPTGITNLIAGR